MDLPLIARQHGIVAVWIAFAARRALRLALLLAIVACVAFALAKASPVDPVSAYLGPAAAHVGPKQRAQIAHRWGFDQPPIVQFGKWSRNLLSGDFGESSIYAAPVTRVVGERALASLALMLPAWLLSGIFGFSLGLIAGAWEGGAADRAISIYAYVLASTPTFWLAIVLLLMFSVWLGWAPFCCAVPPGVLPEDVTLADHLRHLALPVTALSVLGIAQIALHTRTKVGEIMRSNYVTYAFAQGATRRDVALRHAARNAALPAVTILFASIGELFGGSILAEQVFSYPGLGRATVEAGTRGDVPLLLGIALGTALIVSLGNTIADALYRVVDPRLRGPGSAP